MFSSNSKYLPRTKHIFSACMHCLNTILNWTLSMPIKSWLCSIETIYYLINLFYFSQSTFTQLTLRLCISLLILSLSNYGNPKPVKFTPIKDLRNNSKELILLLLGFVLFWSESSSMEDIKWAYLAPEDREILIIDFILESLWRLLILDFMNSSFIGKLLQILLSARLVSITVKSDWHIILHLRFLCEGILIGLAILGVEKLYDMKVYWASNGANNGEKDENLKGTYNTRCMRKSKTAMISQNPERIEGKRTYTEIPSKSEISKESRTNILVLSPEESKDNLGDNDNLIELTAKQFKGESSVSETDLAKILNYLPEGVIVLNLEGSVKFMNRYMHGILEFNEKITIRNLSQSLSDFQFREASLQGGHSLSVLRDTSFSSQDKNPWKLGPGSLSSKLSRAQFLRKLERISSLESLFTSCTSEPEIRDIAQRYVPTFQTRYHQHSTDEWFSIELKVHLLSESEQLFVILLRDITDRENKLISLEKEKTLYRDNLIASFSHELRTPLNSNLAFLEQCMDSPSIPGEVKKDLVKPALDSGRLLLFIVNDILDYSLMIVNKMRLDIKPFDITQTVRQCLDLFEMKASQKNLRLNLQADKEVFPIIYSDQRRISQVLTNLLSNAVQFTTEGEIRVIISRSLGRNIKITVRDTGIGMGEHAQGRLKETLSNEILKEKLSEASVGIGLGLFISNKMIKVLDSDGSSGLQFKSESGRGSEFSFEIKNREPRESHRSKTLPEIGRDFIYSELDEESDLSNKLKDYNSYSMKNVFRTPKKAASQGCQIKALIVDDEIFNIIVLENFCKSLGIATEKAFNGREALNKLKVASYDNTVSIKIVFMDINMPLMDGYETTIAINEMIEREEIEDVVVIGVTAYVSRDMIEKGIECGMKEVMNKPVTKEGLIEILRKYKFLEERM